MLSLIMDGCGRKSPCRFTVCSKYALGVKPTFTTPLVFVVLPTSESLQTQPINVHKSATKPAIGSGQSCSSVTNHMNQWTEKPIDKSCHCLCLSGCHLNLKKSCLRYSGVVKILTGSHQSSCLVPNVLFLSYIFLKNI